MKKFIIFSLALGVLASNSLILKEIAADANLSSKDIQHEQVAKAPAKYSTNVIWFMG
nr:hypothetical protein [uncultured Trichococcus sp.]